MSYNIYNNSCYGLKEIQDNSVDAIITDPPYGIKLEKWDNFPEEEIWKDCFRVLKPGGFLLCFSSIKYQHIFTTTLLQSGFVFKDTLLWVFLNGRVPPIDVDKKIDDHLGIEREIIGQYKYKQGKPNSKKDDSYKKITSKTKASETSQVWQGFGIGLKTAYEPIIMVQKPIENNFCDNLLTYGTGALNIEATKIPLTKEDKLIPHNVNKSGRVMANIIQTEPFGDYQKFFFVGKVRDGKKTGNTHPTVKPLDLMTCLIKLVSKPNDIILDPFMGSGSTGIASLQIDRNFVGYEIEKTYYEIAVRRLKNE